MENLSGKRYAIAAWVVVGLFLVYCLATLNYNGPFFDEAIYITAGERGLEGHAIEDQYLSWFAGSMLWPTLSGLGYRVAGLVGARAVAALFATVALAAMMLAARNLFGRPAAFWATLAMALNGPFLSMARLAVYDLAALAGIGVSFWAITELARRDSRGWLVLAAFAYVAALFAKYPMGLMILPLVALTVVLRRRKSAMDLGMLGFIVLPLVLVFYLPLQAPLSELGVRLAPREILRQPAVVTLSTVVYFSIAPILLALLGWLIARGRRALAILLVMSLMIWPAYHLRQELVVSYSKHVVFGCLFGYPLIGLALATMWDQWKRRAAVVAILATLVMIGLVQRQQLDQIWPDVRVASGYLVANVQPGDKLLINDSWPYVVDLYDHGRIEKPQDVIDIYSRAEAAIDLCDYDWFVDSDYTPKWPAEVLQSLEQCGTFRPVFSTVSSVSRLNFTFDYIVEPVKIVVWQNGSQG